MFARIATRTGVQLPSPPLSFFERKFMPACPAAALCVVGRLGEGGRCFKDKRECEALAAKQTLKKNSSEPVLNASDRAVMIAARAGPQSWSVESFRDEGQLNRGLSRASTKGQSATR
jgi:hypothetical protein